MQTTQSEQQDLALPGQLRGELGQFDIDGTRLAEVAVAAGLFVCMGTAPADQAKLPTSANEVQLTGLGFAMRRAEMGVDSSTGQYAIGDAISIAKFGPGFWAVAGEDLTIGDPVFVVFGATDRGKVRNDVSSGGTEAARLHGARVERSASSGQPVLISLHNLPVADLDVS